MFVIIFILFLLVLYLYGTRSHNYWRDKNVPHDNPIPFFGTHYRNYMQIISRAQITDYFYRKHPTERFVGEYRGLIPELIIRDPELIKHILTTDFQYFYARGLGRDPKVEPLLESLFHADGDLWKLARQRLTPAFTSGKLKNMFPLIVECAEQLQVMVEKKCDTGEPQDVREIMARFTTDFIGACGFGIKMDSINNNNSKFRELGKEMFKLTFLSGIKLCLKELCPILFGNLHPQGPTVENNINDLLLSILKQRNYKPVGRNDFIDLLLELKSQGKIVTDSIEHFDKEKNPKQVEREIDMKFMTAQVFVFFGAGFETSSSATSHALYRLAHNPHVQVEVQNEVDEVLAKYDNKLCYEAVKDMKYLENTLLEALRLFPSLGVLNRVCTAKYNIPDTNICIDKGVLITIPVSSLHKDEKYFKHPEEFDPDRFLPENSRDRPKYTFLPFGEGPRACVGLRLGLMQSMAGLAALLSRFSFEPAPSSGDIKISPKHNVVQLVVGGIPLIIKRRNKITTE